MSGSETIANAVIKAIAVVLVIVGILAIIVYAGIFMFANKVRNHDIQDYCSRAGVPAYAECVDRYAWVEYKGNNSNGFLSLETRKFRSVAQMVKSLPDGFGNAVEETMEGVTLWNTSEYEFPDTFKDNGNTPVIRHEVPYDMIPVDKNIANSDVEVHFMVLEYADKSFRFAVFADLYHN